MAKRKGVSKNRGNCRKCGKYRPLTKHHIIPKRLRLGDGRVVLYCRECHDRIEELIARLEIQVLRAHQYIYFHVLERWG